MSTVHAPYHERLTVGDGTIGEDLLMGLIPSEFPVFEAALFPKQISYRFVIERHPAKSFTEC
jgi:hypothetical protein